MTKESLNLRGSTRFVPSSIGILLALLVFVAFPSSSALAQQCEDVEFTEEWVNTPWNTIRVRLTCGTSGSIIFYKFSEWAPVSAPTHSGSTATGGTMIWNLSYYPVYYGHKGFWKAVCYKAGYADSNVVEYWVDNSGN